MMRAGLSIELGRQDWANAAITAGNLSDLEALLGDVGQSQKDAAKSVTYADRSGDERQRQSKRARHAIALVNAGNLDDADTAFREAEQMQANRRPSLPRLSALQGFYYGDRLLIAAERAAWRVTCGGGTHPIHDAVSHGATLREVYDRARQSLELVTTQSNRLLDIALDYLTLGRVTLYEESSRIARQRGPHGPFRKEVFLRVWNSPALT